MTVCVQIFSEGKIAKIISIVGSLSFGIYLLHPYLRILIYGRYYEFLGCKMPVLLESVCWCIISMVVCGVFTMGLKKLPCFRKLL